MHKNELIYNLVEQNLFPYNRLLPKITESAIILPGVKIVGDVTIGEKTNIWFNSVIRGDVHYVKIGNETNIQDLSMLHVTNGEFPLNIGNKVTVGHSAKIHGCTIEDLTLIGIGAIVLDGAHVEKNSIVAAGAVVKPGFRVPSGTLVAGVPAKVVRELTQDEIDYFEISAKHYVEYAEQMINSLITEANEN